MNMVKWTCFTDGSSDVKTKKPYIGAWTFSVMEGGLCFSSVGHKIGTTNNEMELTALLMCLRYLPIGKNVHAVIHSDSEYCLKGIIETTPKGIPLKGSIEPCSDRVEFLGWVNKWENNGWKSSTGPVKNLQLWKDILTRIREMSKGGTLLEFVWVKGHSVNEDHNRVDRLAQAEKKRIKILKIIHKN
jgi:ribonuclease HI